MITLVRYPEYFKGADERDIERELIGLVLDKAKHDLDTPLHTLPPKLRKSILNDEVRCVIDGIRNYRYHAPSRPGWTALHRVRWGFHKNRLVEVRWLPMY
jgi:hypothetical protein